MEKISQPVELNINNINLDTIPEEPQYNPPEGDDKKYYAVGCYSAEDWKYIHEVLMKDGTLEDNIPCECVECYDLKQHSETRAVYLLTDAEAEELRNHPKVKYVHYDPSSYPEFFPKPKPFSKFPRNSQNKKQYRNFWNGSFSVYYTDGSSTTYQSQFFKPILPSADNASTSDGAAADVDRSGYQLSRCTERKNKWWKNNGAITEGIIEQHGDGTGVDVIVADEGCWIGHPEFVTTGYGPDNFVGGNVLNNSTAIGVCNVLDLVLDSPYYIDPEWFDANPGTRLTTRWDGTTVPVESVARTWWGNGAQRSAQFASIGTVTIPAAYTRAANNGTNAAHPTYATHHGTQCACCAFGKSQGWAYNANKWVLNLYGGASSIGSDEAYFDVMKLFHTYKPNNTTLGTKDPTICSNSYGLEIAFQNGFYWFRQGTGGGSGNTFTVDGDGVPSVNFMRLTGGSVYERADDSTTTAGDEMIAAGVIFVAASGNSASKLVSSTHPDYNNYWHTSNSTPLTSATFSTGGVTGYRTINRRGWPAHVGKYTAGGQVVYPGILIGAMDDTYTSDGKEQKVNYSSRGNDIDCYAPAEGTLTGVSHVSAILINTTTGTESTVYIEADSVSSGLPTAGVQHPTLDDYPANGLWAKDAFFNGTSAACPVACGLIATKLQHNRDWGWQDVRNWIKGTSQPTGITTVGQQEDADFYFGSESTSANTTNWLDYNSLEGGDPIVIWDAPTGSESKDIGLSFKGQT